MTEIANAVGTDKGTIVGESHGYSCLYDVLFAMAGANPSLIVEIGLLRGGPEAGGSSDRKPTATPSVDMWRQRFPGVRVYGLDICDFSEFNEKDFTYIPVDCGNSEQLSAAADCIEDHVDLIVDDGSHASYHQQITLLALFEKLRPGGLYIIEDLHSLPEANQRRLPKVPRTDVVLGRFASSGRFGQTGSIERARWEALGTQIRAVFMFDAWVFRDAAAHHRRQYGLGNAERVYRRGIRVRAKWAAHAALGAIGSAIRPGSWSQPRIIPTKLVVIQKA